MFINEALFCIIFFALQGVSFQNCKTFSTLLPHEKTCQIQHALNVWLYWKFVLDKNYVTINDNLRLLNKNAHNVNYPAREILILITSQSLVGGFCHTRFKLSSS